MWGDQTLGRFENGAIKVTMSKVFLNAEINTTEVGIGTRAS